MKIKTALLKLNDTLGTKLNQATVGFHTIPLAHYHPIPLLNNSASDSYSAVHV